jgi:AGZA family xanthine/uracil permease-like MFS transporter
MVTMGSLGHLAFNPEGGLAPESLVQADQMSRALVFVSGVIFLVLSLGGIRERIINGVPKNIKLALGSGIGLFIFFLGLRQAGISRPSMGTIATMVNFGDWTAVNAAGQPWAHSALLSLAGLLIIAVLSAWKVKGSILIGIIATAVLAYATGFSTLPDSFSLNPVDSFRNFGTYSLFTMDFTTVFRYGVTGAVITGIAGAILAFVLVNLLDSLGTIFGTASAAGMTDENGEVVGLRKGLTADALGTTNGGALGSSTTTTLVSSASVIAEGGRTGLTSLTTGILFAVALVAAPFVQLIPLAATAPALLYVGFLMMGNIRQVDFSDVTEALPAFLAIAIMPLTFSITNGIAFALISFVVLKVATRRFREISVVSVIIAALFVAQFILS